MGSAESRFREAVKNGDHARAYELFYGKKIVRDSVDPEHRCFEESGSSLLHFTATHAMEKLYRDFLTGSRASPMESNGLAQNCLHLICSGDDKEITRYRMLLVSLSSPFVKDNITRTLQAKDKVCLTTPLPPPSFLHLINVLHLLLLLPLPLHLINVLHLLLLLLPLLPFAGWEHSSSHGCSLWAHDVC